MVKSRNNMSRIVELLKEVADIEKKAYSQTVTSFSANSIAALAKSGMPFEKAASVVADACEKDESLSKMAMQYLLLEKIAEHVEALELRCEELTKVAQEVEIVESDEQIDKLASLGFSKDEISAMRQVDIGLVEKVASVTAAPVEMGAGVGVPRERTDPLLEFILG